MGHFIYSKNSENAEGNIAHDYKISDGGDCKFQMHCTFVDNLKHNNRCMGDDVVWTVWELWFGYPRLLFRSHHELLALARSISNVY